MSELQKLFDEAMQKSKKNPITCPNCNSPIRSHDEYCSVCGYNLYATSEESSANNTDIEYIAPQIENSVEEIPPKDNSTDDYIKKTSINKMVKVKDSFFDDSVLEDLKQPIDLVEEDAVIEKKTAKVADEKIENKKIEKDPFEDIEEDGYFGTASIKDSVINKKKKVQITLKKK